MTSAGPPAAARDRPEGGGVMDGVAGGRHLARHLAGHLARHVALAAVAGAACTLVWSAAGGRYWPLWVWLGAGVSVSAHVGALRAARSPAGHRRVFVVHVWASATLAAAVTVVWLVTSPGSGWVRWPLIGLAVALSVHAAVLAGRPPERRRERELTDRVAELTRSRRGAVEVQADELRRIERDLHDGAQARLVALSLQLGRAELAIAAHPQAPTLTAVADLVQGAHRHADAALAELRDLVSGIAPPILTDRGLVEAVGALARRAGVPVTVRADVVDRPAPAVELAAYFVVAEALTNALKHAGSAQRPPTVAIELEQQPGRLLVRVADDGPGGADAAGNGLRGLAQRVAALDGTFSVADRVGGGTVVTAALETAAPGGGHR